MTQAPKSDGYRAALLTAKLLLRSNKSAGKMLAPLIDRKPQTIRGALTGLSDEEATEQLIALCSASSEEKKEPREETVSDLVETRKDRDKLRTLQRQLSETTAQIVALESLRDTILEIDKTPTRVSPIKALSSGRGRLTFLATRADFHRGKEVRLEDVHGLQRYDPQICSDRMKRTSAITVRLIRESNAQPDCIVLAFNGDNINGELREDDVRNNLEHPIDQAIGFIDDAVSDISNVADSFPGVPIRVVITYGNHPRLTLKPSSEDTHYNLEYLAGMMIAKHFHGDDRVEVTVPREPDCFIPVYGKSVFLTHGDRLGTKGGDGQIGMAGPTIRGMLRIESQIDSVRRYAPDTSELWIQVISHWHEYLRHKRLLVTGSGIGPESYGAKTRRFSYAPAEQSLIMIHHERGVIGDMHIWPGDPSEGPLYGANGDEALRKAVAAAGS